MPETPNSLDIDPSVDEYLNQSIDEALKDPVPSPHFGDDVMIESPKNTILPGETPAQAHIRLQQEDSGKKRD